jgi:hypothetical protein
MQLRFVVAVSALALALPLAPVSAQSTTPSTQSATLDTVRWSFSLGADPTSLNRHTPEAGIQARMVANLTRSWKSGNSRWARHISLMVGGDAPHVVTPFLPGVFAADCSCAMRITRRYGAVTGGASYDLLHVSRFTPYLTGGVGLYSTAFTREPTDGALTPSELTVYQYGGFSENKLSLGANAGLGLKMRLGSHELFIEQIVHEFDINNHGLGVYPLNFGFRF